MSRSSGKLNIIDQNTYQDLKHEHKDSAPRILRSSKYKNKHKKEQQCSLFDFLIVPRKKQKHINRKKRPNLIIARNSLAFHPKRKGKTRLNPKHRVTRLKRIIRSFRQLKLRSTQDENVVETVEQTCGSHSEQLPAKMEIRSTDPELDCVRQEQTINHLSPAHQLHSRRFRSYCDNCTTKSLKELTTQLLSDLERFQKRAYSNNEIKARAHPRLVVGFREALSRLRINKVKLLILAPDCEACSGEGGLDDTIEELKSVCQQQEVPYCFSLMRRELAYALRKRAQISCVAVLDFDGANETYKQLLHELNEARVLYKELTAS
ncbi:selenocysteine insertion sequence-binding protein 2 [Drosophila innubila]|uniref:selenocysteine insertion sequence-binding protein 2 n=1 Tax=Drosophila innubila TaxID=198719 RepID=UPI00148BF401|nr:selenocysteine insertion sequence-binding protein 2 [Drosophila innubila]